MFPSSRGTSPGEGEWSTPHTDEEVCRLSSGVGTPRPLQVGAQAPGPTVSSQGSKRDPPRPTLAESPMIPTRAYKAAHSGTPQGHEQAWARSPVREQHEIPDSFSATRPARSVQPPQGQQDPNDQSLPTRHRQIVVTEKKSSPPAPHGDQTDPATRSSRSPTHRAVVERYERRACPDQATLWAPAAADLAPVRERDGDAWAQDPQYPRSFHGRSPGVYDGAPAWTYHQWALGAPSDPAGYEGVPTGGALSSKGQSDSSWEQRRRGPLTDGAAQGDVRGTGEGASTRQDCAGADLHGRWEAGPRGGQGHVDPHMHGGWDTEVPGLWENSAPGGNSRGQVDSERFRCEGHMRESYPGPRDVHRYDEREQAPGGGRAASAAAGRTITHADAVQPEPHMREAAQPSFAFPTVRDAQRAHPARERGQDGKLRKARTPKRRARDYGGSNDENQPSLANTAPQGATPGRPGQAPGHATAARAMNPGWHADVPAHYARTVQAYAPAHPAHSPRPAHASQSRAAPALEQRPLPSAALGPHASDFAADKAPLLSPSRRQHRGPAFAGDRVGGHAPAWEYDPGPAGGETGGKSGAPPKEPQYSWREEGAVRGAVEESLEGPTAFVAIQADLRRLEARLVAAEVEAQRRYGPARSGSSRPTPSHAVPSQERESFSRPESPPSFTSRRPEGDPLLDPTYQRSSTIVRDPPPHGREPWEGPPAEPWVPQGTRRWEPRPQRPPQGARPPPHGRVPGRGRLGPEGDRAQPAERDPHGGASSRAKGAEGRSPAELGGRLLDRQRSEEQWGGDHTAPMSPRTLESLLEKTLSEQLPRRDPGRYRLAPTRDPEEDGEYTRQAADHRWPIQEMDMGIQALRASILERERSRLQEEAVHRRVEGMGVRPPLQKASPWDSAWDRPGPASQTPAGDPSSGRPRSDPSTAHHAPLQCSNHAGIRPPSETHNYDSGATGDVGQAWASERFQWPSAYSVLGKNEAGFLSKQVTEGDILHPSPLTGTRLAHRFARV
eukprot:jgi/Botrbrau1/22042/Bobra.0024s0054.1